MMTREKSAVYACSFGGPGARGTQEYYRFLSFYLNKFNFVSLREDDGVDFANNTLHLNKKAVWCIDPVFLCDKKHYLELVQSVRVKREGEFIGSYVLIPKAPISNLIKKIKLHFGGIPVELIGEEKKILQTKELIKHSHRDIFPIENALETIHSCKFFVTDSFHGMCFAIIFKKDFLVIPRDFPNRFISLLNRIGLGDRIINANLSNLKDELYVPIDYDKVYEKLSMEIEKSRDILFNALKIKVDDKLTDIDIVMNYIRQQHEELEKVRDKIMYSEEKDRRILQLEKENEELRHMIDKGHREA